MSHARLLAFGAPDWTELYDVLREDALSAALFWHRLFPRRQTGRVLIIPPCEDPGSLGDHAMMSVAVRQIRNAGYPVIDLASNQAWPLVPAPDGRYRFDSKAGLHHRLAALRQLKDYDHVFLIGADVVDGGYNEDVLDRIALLALAARLGSRATILGASFSEAPDAEAVRLLRQLPRSVRINARDPLSRARMENHLRRPIALTADLAALLVPDPNHPDNRATSAWIAENRARGRRVVGFNVNGMETAGCDAIKRGLDDLARRLCAANCALVLVPHDSRDSISDLDALTALQNDLAAEHLPIHLLRSASTAVVKSILGEVDLLVTGRMHAAILAMGAGTPAVSFPYKGKFEGLYRLLGLADAGLLIPLTDLAKESGRVAHSVIDALDRQEALRARLKQHWPAYRQASESNFDDLPSWSAGEAEKTLDRGAAAQVPAGAPIAE